MTKPLVVSVADSMDDIPQEIIRYATWEHVTNAELKPFICGAVAPAIDKLLEKTALPKVI